MKTALFLFTFGYSLLFALEPSRTHGVLNVQVENFDEKPYANTAISFKGQTRGAEFSGKTNSNGKMEILLAKDETYDILYISLTGPYKCGEVRVPANAGKGSITVQYDETTQTLNNVLFDTGKASLRSSSYVELNHLVKGLNQNPNITIEIAGHTDDVGGDDYNMELSQHRAETVRNYLIKKGIDAKRITAVGYGSTQPIESNDTAAGKQANRRTEVRILSK